MRRLARGCLQWALKTVNYMLGLVGIGIIMYSLWVIRAWMHAGDPPFGRPDANPPWFIYTSLGLGISLCVITCSGHVAAETANGHCLSCYMVVIFVLIMLEASITADIFLNRNWEEDFPDDITGKFNELKNFVRSNSELSKWMGVLIAVAQASSILLAIVLRALGPNNETDCDSDDDAVQTRLPLLMNQVQQTSYMADPTPPSNHSFFMSRITDNKAFHWASTSSLEK